MDKICQTDNQKYFVKIINVFNKSKFSKNTELQNFFTKVTIVENNYELWNYEEFINVTIKLNTIKFSRFYSGDIYKNYGTCKCEIHDIDNNNCFVLFEDADYFDNLKNIARDNEDLLTLYEDQQLKNTTINEFFEFIQFIFTNIFDTISN